jgi:hypothetical protein
MFKTICLLLLWGGLSVHAQIVFPTLSCQTLSNKTIELPAGVAGKKTLVAMAFSPKAEKLLRQWNNPLYQALIADGIGGLMSGKMYNAHLYFVGMLKGIAKLGLQEVKKQSKKEIEKKLHDYFMVSDDNVTDLMKQLGVNDTSEPHFFILNEKGEIVYHTQGAYTDNKLNELTEKLL